MDRRTILDIFDKSRHNRSNYYMNISNKSLNSNSILRKEFQEILLDFNFNFGMAYDIIDPISRFLDNTDVFLFLLSIRPNFDDIRLKGHHLSKLQSLKYGGRIAKLDTILSHYMINNYGLYGYRLLDHIRNEYGLFICPQQLGVLRSREQINLLREYGITLSEYNIIDV